MRPGSRRRAALSALARGGAARAARRRAAPRSPRPRRRPTTAAGPPPPRLYDLAYDARFSPNERTARVTVRIGGAERGPRARGALRASTRSATATSTATASSSREADSVDLAAARRRRRAPLHVPHRSPARRAELRRALRRELGALPRRRPRAARARAREVAGALARARLRLRLPDGWSRGGALRAAARRPLRRREPAAPLRPPDGLAPARAPRRAARADRRRARRGGGARRARACAARTLLALLRWTLPTLRKILGALPGRLLVVGAGDPMWRGGLSGPGSVFLHADRPLITNDLTSPLLHELVHATLGIRVGPGRRLGGRGAGRALLPRAAGALEDALEGALPEGPGAARRPRRGRDGARRRRRRRARSPRVRPRRSTSSTSSCAAAPRTSSPSTTWCAASLPSAARVTTERFRSVVDEVAGRSLGAFFRAHVPLHKQPALP